jgi:hypothetical protein
MLGDELSRESQLLLHAAHMSFALPPDVYTIAQGSAGGYRRYCYFITSGSGKNLLVGCPAYNEDLAEALDALGGIDTLLTLNGGGKDAELWQYEFDCEIITSPGAASEERLTEDLLLLHIAGGAMLLYEQHGGVLCGGDLFTIDADGRLTSDQPNPEAIAVLQAYPITAILPTRTQGGFITEGGGETLAMLASRSG